MCFSPYAYDLGSLDQTCGDCRPKLPYFLEIVCIPRGERYFFMEALC